jgi:hypothetical protein
MLEKKWLSAAVLEEQVALELPEREMMQQTGLVNVDIGDVTVQVPIGVAANLCDINAAVLVGQFQDFGAAECTATADSTATNGPGQGGGAR